MAFFGLETNNAIENEKRRFLAGETNAEEDIAVYNWGAEDYDGLGNALQEGGDELNDETFGGSEPVGKDFDFTAAQTLPDLERRPEQVPVPGGGSSNAQEPQPQPQVQTSVYSAKKPQQAAPAQSLWDDKSPFSVFRTASSIGRRAGTGLTHQTSSSISGTKVVVGQQSHSPALPQHSQSSSHTPQQSQAPTDGTASYALPGARTLAEIEAEMRAQAQRAREAKLQEAKLQEHQQQQLLLKQQQERQEQQQLQQRQLQQQLLLQQQQQQLLKPPRMRSQSPSVRRSAPLNAPQAGYQVPPHALEGLRQQHSLVQDVENLRIQDAHRDYHRDGAYTLMEAQNRTHTPGDPVEFMLQRTAERERGLLQGVVHNRLPSREYQQHQQLRMDELDYQEQERRLRLSLAPANVDDANLRQRILAEKQRQAQLAAATALLEQRRDSPMDQPQQQMRIAMASQLVNKTSGDLQNLFAGANPAELSQMQIQMQQRMLAQLAQQEFSQNLAGVNGQDAIQQGVALTEVQREQLRLEAMRKIMEAERQEAKRRRKAQKIAHMSRYNDLMTQSDKDFITRIQVSQLVTSDPYAEDFYAQVYGSLLRSRMGISANEERVLKFGSGEGVGLGLTQRGGNRRQNAMQRMEAQVERIVNNARQREREKGLHAIHSLQGALGKTAGRSYKAAPRQLLQVDTNGTTDSAGTHGHISKEDAKKDAAGAAKEAAKRGREALGVNSDPSGTTRKEPLTRRECLIILESLYDSQLRIEQLRREQPAPDDQELIAGWEMFLKEETSRQWDNLRVMVPLETSDPHPFISFLMPAKGKKLFPRLTRHLSTQQLLQVICLLVACFSQLDVVKNAAVLDHLEDSSERREADKQTQLFLSTVLQCILPVIAKFNLGVVVGMMGLLMEHCDMRLVIHSRPGQSLLTAFLSRAEVIKSEITSGNIEPSEIPTEEDLRSWQGVVVHLFHILSPYFLSLFPSTRIPSLRAPSGVLTVEADLLDQPVWKFLATFALHADNEQQQTLVSTLREKILDNILAVHKGFVTDEQEVNMKITNVNIFLHALGLDSSQINV